MLQQATSDSDSDYIGVRRLLLFRKAESGVRRRLATSDSDSDYIGVRRLILFRKAESGVRRRLAWLVHIWECVRNWKIFGRWLPSSSPLSLLYEVDSWRSNKSKLWEYGHEDGITGGVRGRGGDVGKTPKQTNGAIDGNLGREMTLNARWDLRPRRIELSFFDGENPDGWILKAKRYFTLHRMTNTDKLETTIISFEGEALIWFGWENKWRPFLSWEELKFQLLLRFRSLPNGSIYEEFLMGRGTTALETTIPTKTHEGGGFRKLTEAELQSKLERGLCYKCDEKFSLGHRCRKRELQVVLLQEYEAEAYAMEDVGRESELESKPTEGAENQVVEVSLNSVVGLTSPKTLKLAGEINNQKVVVLIDSGASHNFISNELVSILKLPITNTKPYGVILGTGSATKAQGICRGVGLILQGVETIADFLPLDLGSTEIILGIQWLEMLGVTHINWKTHSMKFNVGNTPVNLQGDLSLHKTLVSLKAICRTIIHEGYGYVVELGAVRVATEETFIFPHEIETVLNNSKEVFEVPIDLPPFRGKKHAIILKEGISPISVRPYRYPQIQKDEIERLVKEMLAAKIIQPSVSPFSSPVLLVKKKDRSWRFCVDYRALNKEMIADKFPIPMINELLDELHGATMFFKLDLKSGYHQIRVRPEDIPKTAFRTHEGHYEFLVMLFGLTNAPAIFQALMNQSQYDRTCTTSGSGIAHFHKVSTICKLQEVLLHLYLFGIFGAYHIRDDVDVDNSKIQAMLEWPVPQSIRELRGFLGLIGYYRKFVKGYGLIAWPLTEQLKKDRFGWNKEAMEAFEALKKAMTTVPVLALPNFTKPFVIEIDASGYGLGAVLMQEEQPMAYYSQGLGQRAKLRSIYEKELMAIVFAIQKWRPYLFGRKFLVRTDQQSLKHLLEQQIVAPDYKKWMAKLLEYDFEIQYKPSASNKVADALSRVLLPTELHQLVGIQWLDWEAFVVQILLNS
ncbi:hypothetical protein KPL70_022865 [Citrus sinensis]|nr:hypothetical protein KPL70_022865 [Citrus sinensis]